MYHVYPFLLLAFVLMPTLSTSQTPFAITGQRAISGNTSDVFGKIIPLSENSQLVIGHTQASQELDHQSSSKGELDLWIIEEENNSINWEKSIGGSQREVFCSALKDRNGDVVILSRSNSQLNGDKSEDSHGLSDFWLVKLDESGTILWDRTIGGSDMESRGKILEYSNGYILIGNSSSNASGNKTVPLIGSSDIWVITLDFDGNITGQDVIGTTEYEEFYDAELISDQEVIISMNSFGLENNSKTVPHFGGGDC